MKLKKDNVIKTVTIAAMIVLFLFIPQLNKLASQTRLEPGYGGECIAWMLPGLLFLLFKTIKETWGA